MELFTIINFLVLIYLIVAVRNLQQRLDAKHIVLDEAPEKEVRPSKKIQATAEDDRPVVTEATSDTFTRFFNWFRRDWQLKVGAFFILLGFVWLVSYAFLNNWIGPVGRIVFGLIMGSGVLAFGVRRIKINIYQGEILTALGAGIILISIYSAQYIYHTMFPPTVALALVTLVTACLAYVSYIHKTVRLAALGLIVGALAPLLIAAETTGVLGLFSYLFCLVVGTVWLVRLTGWRMLTIMALFIVWLYSIPWFTMYISPTNLLYMRFFAVTFTVLFYFLSLASFVVDRTSRTSDAYIGMLIGLYSFHWVTTLVPDHWQSLIFVALAISFMIGSLAIFRLHKIGQPTYLYTAVSIGFLIAATMEQFQGEALASVLATEAFALTVYADRVFGKNFAKVMIALYILPVIFALGLFMDFRYTATHQLSLIYIGASLYAGSIYLLHYARNHEEDVLSIARALLIGAGIYSLAYVWIAMPYHLGYRGDMVETFGIQGVARVVTLIIYALVGIGLYVYGLQRAMSRTKLFGLCLVCFVTGRLLFYEVWDMNLGARIVTFFAIGLIFIASVFVRRSNHEKK